MGDIIEIILAMPMLGKVALAAGVLTPILVLSMFLSPPRTPPPPPPPKRMSVQGDVTIQERPPSRRR